MKKDLFKYMYDILDVYEVVYEVLSDLNYKIYLVNLNVLFGEYVDEYLFQSILSHLIWFIEAGLFGFRDDDILCFLN